MTVKSIVDIELKTDSMQRFTGLYDKFQAQLAKTPNVWKQLGKEQNAIATQFERMTAALMAQNELARTSKEDDARRLKDLDKTNQLWTSISKNSTSLYRNVIGIGTGIIKWGGILAGVATGAGLFGFDRLADSVAGARSSAQGLGVTIGQQKAFDINLGRYVDTGSLLQSTLEMETDPSKRRAWFNLMHGQQMTGNVSQDALAFLQAERTFAQTTPLQNLGVMASALGLPLSIEDLMRLRTVGNEEFGKQMQRTQRDAAALNVPDRSARAAQDFQAQMKRNLGTMGATLWNTLSGLAGPLSDLTAGLTHAGVALLSSPAVRNGIKDFADLLQKFSGTINADAFTSRLKALGSDVDIVADAFHTLAAAWKAIGGLGGAASTAGGAKIGGMVGSIFGLPGRVVGSVVGAAAGNVGHEIYAHGPADYANFYGALGAAYYTPPSAAAKNGAPAPSGGPASLPIGSAITLTILNATGGSAVVAINGLGAQ